jgi:multidrug efflux pump subunit AcrB
MSLAAFSIRRPVLTVMVTLIVVVLGIVSMTRLRTDLLPSIELPTISVRTNYEGADPLVMERLVTQILEEIVATVPGVEEITSQSYDGNSRIRVTFAWGTSIDTAATDVRATIEDEINELPDDVGRPRVSKFDIDSFPVVLLGISSTLDPVELTRVIEDQIRFRFARVPGVAQVDLWGGFEREMRIELDPQRINSLGLGLNGIIDAIRDANLDLPAGKIERGRYEVTLRAPAEFTRLEEIRQTVIGERDGAMIRLGQVAQVKDTYRKLTRHIRVNGERGLRVAIRKQPEANTVEVARAVLEEVEAVNRALPAINVIPVINQGNFIERSIANVSRSVLYGGTLAVLVLLLFLRSLRSTAVIAMSIPISVVATFALIYFGGFTLNLMTLGGLALGVGMMVDSSVVVLENIFRRQREFGESAREAAIRGTNEVSGAIIAGTLTTLVVFLPLVFVRGLTGLLFTELALVIIFALICSLLVSLSLLPMLASRFLDKQSPSPRGRGDSATASASAPTSPPPPGEGQGGGARRMQPNTEPAVEDPPPGPLPGGGGVFREPHRVRAEGSATAPASDPASPPPPGEGQGGGAWQMHPNTEPAAETSPPGPLPGGRGEEQRPLAEAYRDLLHGALRFRWLVVLASAALLAASLQLFPLIGSEFIPPSDEGEVRITGEMEVGSRLDLVEQQTRKMEAIVYAAVPEAESSVVSVGSSGYRPGGAARGEIRLSLVPAAQRQRSNSEIAADLRKRLDGAIPGMKIRTRAPQGQFLLERLLRTDEGITIEVRGHDLDTLGLLAQRAADVVEGIEGVADIKLTREVGVPQRQIHIDRDKAADLGISVRDVTRAISIAIAGAKAGEFRVDGDSYRILVQMADAERRSIDEVLDLTLTADSGRQVALRNLVTTEEGRGPTVIDRKDQQRLVTIDVNIAGRDQGSVAEEVRQRLSEIARPQGYAMLVTGSYEEQQKATRELVTSLLLALALVYMVLASQYESLRDPLVVMLSVPMAAIGVLVTLFITNTTFNLQSYIGCIMLGGIVVNNAILLVDQASRLQREGITPFDAALEAGRRRLRPILMTTLTTILALAPLALGIGEGADAQAPLARAVIGGLIGSTLITLVLIPAVYTLFHPANRR